MALVTIAKVKTGPCGEALQLLAKASQAAENISYEESKVNALVEIAEVQLATGDIRGTLQVLTDARQTAKHISNKRSKDRTLKSIDELLEQIGEAH